MINAAADAASKQPHTLLVVYGAVATVSPTLLDKLTAPPGAAADRCHPV